MTILQHITKAVQQYDVLLKVIGALAAPGGVWFWIDKYRNRIRIRVRNFGFIRGDLSGRGISFELENIGDTMTSLEPSFSVVAYSPKCEKHTYMFRIEGKDRRLPPHDLVPIRAWHNDRENRAIAFGWYMAFTLPLTRGRDLRVRVRNAEFQQLSWFQFQWGRLLFKIGGMRSA